MKNFIMGFVVATGVVGVTRGANENQPHRPSADLQHVSGNLHSG